MPKTLVIQSHRNPLPATWLQTCIDSVFKWANINNYEYKFIGDELFNYVSDEVLNKAKRQPIIATDLARLVALQEYLQKGYERVVWCDADFLIFSPEKFHLPDQKYAVGREIWIQYSGKNKNRLSVHMKVHNAFMMFRKGNSFLDFYTDTAERLLLCNQGSMPPQFIGPKLLTAIHNVAQCPVHEGAGMLSPLVIKDIAAGGGPALEMFKIKSLKDIAAANLCSSLYAKNEVSADEIENCIANLRKL